MHSKKNETYASYIQKIWKTTHPGLQISSTSMKVLNGIVKDTFTAIATETKSILEQSKTVTMSSRSVQTATRLVLVGDLAKQGDLEGVDAVKKEDSVFPVGRLHRYLKDGPYAKRVSRRAALYMAGVLQYLVTEILEVAGTAMQDARKKTLTPRHLSLAIKSDEELDKVLGSSTVASGGIRPYIERALLVKKKPSKRASRPKSYMW